MPREALALLLVVAACGGSKTSGQPATPSTSSAPPPTDPAQCERLCKQLLDCEEEQQEHLAGCIEACRARGTTELASCTKGSAAPAPAP